MAQACLAAGFGPFGLERVIALAYPLNAASIRVMHKCGMRPAGTVHAHGHDLVCYEALLAPVRATSPRGSGSARAAGSARSASSGSVVSRSTPAPCRSAASSTV